VVGRGGDPIAGSYRGTHQQQGNAAAGRLAAAAAVAGALVPDEGEHTVRTQTGNQVGDQMRQEAIGEFLAAIVTVVAEVGADPGKCRRFPRRSPDN